MCLCALENLFDVVGKKWNLLILEEIGKHKKLRFKNLIIKFEGISPSTLTSSLKKLEKEGIIQRKFYQEIPLRVEYSLSEKGEELRKVLTPLIEWSEMNSESEKICKCIPNCCNPEKTKSDSSSQSVNHKLNRIIEASMCACTCMVMMTASQIFENLIL